MSTTTLDHAHGHDDHHGHPHGLGRWLFATNHKDIGTLYLWFSLIMLLSGGVLALMIRSELFQPGLQFFQPEFFNQLTTMHGLVMVFGAIMPAPPRPAGRCTRRCRPRWAQAWTWVFSRCT
jgi:cytochrome c oxidase subunit 1